ncbi:Ig-like domain-containing protein [Actinotalea subterranea]|uniref:Ig-like domain-containing protein n=1 Tax=Actinotalea subterranea TaxID=2607497 RepID=UPI0011EDD02D|nr:Ig-like domain-containing protein [Actinotalea subterranea]
MIPTAALSLLAAGMVTPLAAHAVPGAEVPQSTLGYPEFHGSDTPVPEVAAPYSPASSYLATVFEEDLAAGAGSAPGQDFWVDRMLARSGPMFDATENLVAFTRGRAVFMKTHQPTQLGWAGDVAYWESLGGGGAFTYSVSVDGAPVTLTEQASQRRQTPSYFTSVFTGAGLTLTQTKFITHENVMVANVQVTDTSGAGRTVRLTATSPQVQQAEGDELTGAVQAFNALTTVFPRLSGDGFTAQGTTLVTDLAVPASGSATTKLQLGMTTRELPGSEAEYAAVRTASPAEAFTTHVTTYNRWWVENIPYLDTPVDDIDKTLFYRWWLMRFNFLDADIPGNDFQFPTSVEGALGYNNAIVLTVGMFLDDLKYVRDPAYAYGTAISVGETSESGKFTDNPGDPANWSNSYTQYITEAAWRAYELHGGPGAIGGLLGQHAMDDVEGLLDAYDSNGNDLIEYSWGAMTGNDADAVSFHWPGHGANMDRTESAYLYSNSLAAAEFFRVAGEDEKAAHMDALAQRIKTAVLENLWEPAQATPDQVGLYGNLLKHRMTQDGTLNPYKETNNYYPFTVGLMPKQGDPDYDPAYVEALRLFADAEQYPVFPFYTANQVDKADSPEEGSNNFSVINSTVLFRMLSSVLRDYPSDYVTPETYKQLLYWNAWAHYQGDGDNRLPNQNEFWSNGSAQDGGSIGYRSWIHHTILGATNFTMIEDAMGLRSRADAKVELDPVDIDWPYFTANNIRYHDRDLTVVWDETGEHYGADVPAGYSVYLDGALAFTVSDLAHVVYDPATGTVEVVEGDAEVVTATTAPLASAAEVTFAADDRVVDVLAKAGTDVAPASTGSVNLAEGRPVTATYSSSGRAPEGAVDGTTVNEPFWGTLSSPNATDSIEVELDGMQAVDDVRVYFYRSSSTATVQGYAAPELFTLEYHDGDGWHTAPDQARTPVYPTANYNRVQLPEVRADRLRVTVTHASGFRTGVKEIQAFATGVPAPAATNAAPDVSVVRDLAFDQPGQVRLVGTVRDDALPAGTLASRWAVVSTPEGADAVIGSPGSATTVVRVDTSGRYLLRLTADDGELSTSRDVVLDVEVSGTAKTNVAPGASATASAVTSWNRVAAINDGNAAFPIAAESDAWATWGTTPGAGGTWTATLTWGAPVRVDESRILFHDNGDPGGILTPSSWSLEYRTAEGTWQPVPSPSEYPTARGELNAVTHASVTTTALRATLVRQGASYPGIVEWQALAEEPVAIEKVAVRTLVGVAPVLPGTVEVLYADGSRAERAVTWQDVPAEAYAEQGSVTVPGFVEGTAGLARATVWVRPTDAVQVNTFTQVAVSTVAGTAPSLPARVVAVYNDGSEASLPVTWDAVDPAGYAEPGELTVQGTVAGTDKRPTAVVTVTEGAAQAPVVALSTEPAVPASGWFTGPVAVTVSATDDSDPAPAVEVRVDDGAWTPYDGPVTVASDGRHAVRARATDSGGLVSAVQTLAVDVDTTAPAVQAAFDEGTRRLTLTTTETGSGVASVEYRVDGGSWTTYGSGATIAQQAVVEHRATDRAGNVSQIGSLDVPAPDPDAPVNVAPNAAVTVSASTSWNRAAGIVDGNATVPVTSQAAAWGTWNIAGDTQWARLDWPEPVTTSTSRLLFFDDGGGMRVPSAWTLEYLLEDGVTWATVPEPSGFTTTAGAFDTVTHAPVTTTALRATLTKPATGWVGIVEWEVLSAPRAPMVLEVPAEVAAGQSFTATLTGGEPGASYAVTLEPGGTGLGTLTTDATGAGALTTAALPAGLDAGAYTVRAVAGESVVEAGLTVTAGPEDLVVVPGTVEVAGVPTVGQVLLARAEGWAPDGVTLAYQWFVDGRAVRDATGSEYTPVRRDLGKTVTVEVTGYLEGYEGASATSEPTAAVALPAVQAGTVAVSGDARVGSRQHATAAGWAQDVRLSYRWTVDGEEVRGGRGATYTPRPSDVGKALAVQVRGEASGHTASSWVASPPVTVQPGQIDADDVRILGRAQPRWPLLAWTDPWGPFPVSLTYQWYADGEPIDGATSPFYQVRTADRGAELTVQVTGTRDGYAPATRTSDAVKVGR